MTQQIKKKFLDPEIISYFDNQIDAAEQGVLEEKTRAEGQESAIRSEFASADEAKLLEAKQFAQDQDALKLAEAKEYAELKVAEAKSEIMGGIPSATLDTITEIAEALASEQTATGAILTKLSELEAADAAEVLARDAAISVAVMAEQQAREAFDALLQSSLEEEIEDRQGIDEELSQRIDSTATSLMGTIGAVNSALIEEVSARQQGDVSTLEDAKDYTDAQIAAIPSVDLSVYYTKAEVDSKDAAIQSELDNLDGYSQDLRDDVDGHETRIVALENKVDGPSFSNEKLTVGSELGFVELSMEVKKIMSCAVGRLAVHEGEDFDVTVVGGKSRLTWKGSLLAPSGAECIESGMNVFVVYAY
jgi:hypothetical protein